MVTVALARSSDAHDVLEFWRQATTVASSTDDLDGIETLLEFDADALVVARDGAAVVGSLITGWDGWRASMYRLAVAPAYRRRGIARQLVAAGEARLRALGARRLHIIVQEREEPARGFWQAVGYQPTAQLRFVKTLS
jgi:ribosomal protein S18 acetylase RimI-like enzyme